MSLFGISTFVAGLLAAAAPAAPAPVSPLGLLEAAPAAAWQRVDPENVLLMDLPSGRVFIELQPELAPQHVARVRALTRAKFYDGVTFHRVIDGFMAQGGDPTGTGQGGSELPDLPGEFAHLASAVDVDAVLGRDDRGTRVGFVGNVPVTTQPPSLTSFLVQQNYALWGMHCPGVMSMARTSDPNSANSQFFLMLGDARDNLDQKYTVWGRVLTGQEHARRINRGEPPSRPTPIVRMRVLADVPAEERMVVERLDPAADVFKSWLVAARFMTEDGFVEDACRLSVPARINGEVKL